MTHHVLIYVPLYLTIASSIVGGIVRQSTAPPGKDGTGWSRIHGAELLPKSTAALAGPNGRILEHLAAPRARALEGLDARAICAATVLRVQTLSRNCRILGGSGKACRTRLLLEVTLTCAVTFATCVDGDRAALGIPELSSLFDGIAIAGVVRSTAAVSRKVQTSLALGGSFLAGRLDAPFANT